VSAVAAPRKLLASQLVSLEVFAPKGALTAKGWVVQIGPGVRIELSGALPFGEELLGTSVQIGCADTLGLYYGHAPLLAFAAGPPAHVVLGGVSELRHVQRREHFRVDAELPITYSLAPSEAPPSEPRRARTTNVSGGGLHFLIESAPENASRLRERDRFWVDLAIPSSAPSSTPPSARILSEAEVVRTNVVRALRSNVISSVAAKFVGLSERERDKLIRYLFELQRHERLKRGW
jgi:PilZ domain